MHPVASIIAFTRLSSPSRSAKMRPMLCFLSGRQKEIALAKVHSPAWAQSRCSPNATLPPAQVTFSELLKCIHTEKFCEEGCLQLECTEDTKHMGGRYGAQAAKIIFMKRKTQTGAPHCALHRRCACEVLGAIKSVRSSRHK